MFRGPQLLYAKVRTDGRLETLTRNTNVPTRAAKRKTVAMYPVHVAQRTGKCNYQGADRHGRWHRIGALRAAASPPIIHICSAL